MAGKKWTGSEKNGYLTRNGDYVRGTDGRAKSSSYVGPYDGDDKNWMTRRVTDGKGGPVEGDDTVKMVPESSKPSEVKGDKYYDEDAKRKGSNRTRKSTDAKFFKHTIKDN